MAGFSFDGFFLNGIYLADCSNAFINVARNRSMRMKRSEIKLVIFENGQKHEIEKQIVFKQPGAGGNFCLVPPFK